MTPVGNMNGRRTPGASQETSDSKSEVDLEPAPHPAQSAGVAVVAIRADGRRVLFTRAEDIIAAQRLVVALERLGMGAVIDPVAPSGLPPGSNLKLEGGQ